MQKNDFLTQKDSYKYTKNDFCRDSIDFKYFDD